MSSGNQPSGNHGGSKTTDRVIIVGGGLAGLAAAVECASHGLDVTLVEKNHHLGGKMNLIEEQGFSFDMGPTIITLPQVLRGIIRRAAGADRVGDYIDLRRLDPQWRCMYEDGTVVDLLENPAQMAAALDRQFPGARPGAGYQAFVDWSRRMYRLSEKVFFYKDLGGIADMMKSPPKEPGIMGDVMAMRMHSTVGDTVHKYIKEPHVRQLCEHFLQYVGSSPFLAPAILGLIASAQTDQGCWYPMGGTRMVARTLERLARERGVTLITGVGVSRIITKDRAATGVVLEDGRELSSDAVVSNCDVQRTYRDLVGTPEAVQEQRSIATKYVPACSGLVLYLGLDRQYDHLAHHDFLFSADSHAEFQDIYTLGIPARDPTLYLAVPSRTDPSQAPVGGEALYVLIHTAHLRHGHRWENPDGTPGPTLGDYRRVVLDKLKRFGMEDIEDHIVVERHLTPQGIERMYNAEGGAIYGLASHGKLHGGFKPRNRSKTVKGLYLAGGSANPGPGVPMVLMSGVTAARSVIEDLGGTPSNEFLRVTEDATPVEHGAMAEV
ncbi:MAG: phytoene desaturase [Phycisphaerales bacterium]|nr:phytoene desaturase [Phycisphaerales bacterium]